MSKKRILFVSPEIVPYLPATENSRLGRDLPTAMQSRKFEVRTFMPDFGAVNERRNQLHEVIRLSGINIPIGDSDHPLIIKVASMQPSRIQVYFIDNEDFFQKSDDDSDAIGSNRSDNDERIIFFARGTVDTARKLRWEPDMLHAAGWFSSLVPLYVKRIFNDGCSFVNTKIVYTVLNEEAIAPLDTKILDKLRDDGVPDEDIAAFEAEPVNANLLHKIAIKYADGVVFNTTEPDPELEKYAAENGIPVLKLQPEEENADIYLDFYNQLMTDND